VSSHRAVHLLCAALVAISVAGCFAHAEDRCRGCAIVRYDSPEAPFVPDGKRGLVVLLHGAFGFGSEWDPIRAALDRRPDLAWFAFSWPGPFGGRPPDRAEAFRRTLQDALQRLPPSTTEVLVLAHSAGGPIAEFAARRLVVPQGVHVHVALLDASRVSMARYQPVESIDTPLGLPVGATHPPTPPLPARVDVSDYRANDPPKKAYALVEAARPREISIVAPTGERIYYLGRKVSHGGSVAVAGLPLIERLAAPAAYRDK
jgi:pimeloyl-ACP methyl ester carboxylesterase